MNSIKQNVSDISVPRDKVATPSVAEVTELLQELLPKPSTLGLQILKALLPKDLSLVENRVEYSEKGHYWWLPLPSNPFFECGLCLWPPGSASLRHDHYHSKALVVPLHGAIEHTLYHVSHNKFFVFSKEESRQLWPFFVNKWQIHNVRNASTDWAISLHCYWLRRASLELVTED